jgi:TolB-like protein/Tfp pilus assembly protein PilF
MHDTEAYCFGSFRLLPRRRVLLHGGAPVQLGSRAFHLLLALVKRQGQLATKDELLAEVWPGTTVEENNLAAQVSALRKVLAADPESAACLHTVPGRGYCFVAVVDHERSLDPVDDGPARSGASAGLAVVVLPFSNLSNDAEQAYFAEGLTETVATDLSRISGLVINASTMAPGAQVDIARLCRDLGVEFALKGSTQRNGKNVRIIAQLIDGRRAEQVWSERFDGNGSDLFTLQDQITARIVNSIGREIFVAAARERDARRIDQDPNALVIRGIVADNEPQSLQSLQQQEHLFGQAVLLDPNNGEALARMARAILLQGTQNHVPAESKDDRLRRGAEAAEKAVAVSRTNARAHLAVGLLHMLRGDFALAAMANNTAIALNCSLPHPYGNLGSSLTHLGLADRAIPFLQQALGLDPLGPQNCAFLTGMGLARLVLGQPEAAVAWFLQARESNPKLARAHAGLALALASKGDIPAARLAAAGLLQLAPDFRLSETIDAPFYSSPPRYRELYSEVMVPAAKTAGVPI